MSDIEDVAEVWSNYVASVNDWKSLIAGVGPKPTGCGPVYELDSPLNRTTESFAIADMTGVQAADPHYHRNGETEIYIVLAGTGKVVVGSEVKDLVPGTVVITPPMTSHYAISDGDLVLAVINTPPFSAENVVDVIDSDPAVQFDRGQFDELVNAVQQRQLK